MYQDDLKIFIEMELDKVSWFKNLSIATKNEIIYGMEREEKTAGSMLVAAGTKADRMYLVQSGTIDIYTSYDKNGTPFLIERLERGCIINHRSFIVEDEIDTDYTCKEKVSVFSLSLEKVKEIMKRR